MKIKLMLLPQSTLVIGGGEFLIPHEDKIDAIIPINVLFCYDTITSLGER